MTKIFFSVILLTIATGSMAIPRLLNRFQHRIVVGEEVPVGSVPFIVSLQTTSGFHYCAGSIVNENWVITAAHCTTGDSPSDVHVHAGVHDLSQDDSGFEQHLTVQTILIHDNYGSSGYGYDLSLLQLTTPAQLGDSIRVNSVRLAQKGFVPTGTATMYGWGNSGSSGIQATDLQLVDDDTCSIAYPGQTDESMLCAETNEPSECQANSGGPLVYREADGDRTLIGIVSWDRGCGLDGYPKVFSEIQVMRDWIDGIVS